VNAVLISTEEDLAPGLNEALYVEDVCMSS
jgi:hypothetical protein